MFLSLGAKAEFVNMVDELTMGVATVEDMGVFLTRQHRFRNLVIFQCVKVFQIKETGTAPVCPKGYFDGGRYQKIAVTA